MLGYSQKTNRKVLVVLCAIMVKFAVLVSEVLVLIALFINLREVVINFAWSVELNFFLVIRNIGVGFLWHCFR